MRRKRPAEAPPPDLTEVMRAYLRASDVCCPVCRYELRDLEGSRCPECGKALTLHLRPTEEHTRCFVLACIALALGCGFFGIFTLLSVVGMLVDDAIIWPPPPIFFFMLAFALLEVAGLLVLFRLRDRFARASTRWQRAIVLGCWAITCSLLAIVIPMFFA